MWRMVLLSDTDLPLVATWEDCFGLPEHPKLGILAVLVTSSLVNGFVVRRFVWQATLVSAQLTAGAGMVIFCVENHVMTMSVCSCRDHGNWMR